MSYEIKDEETVVFSVAYHADRLALNNNFTATKKPAKIAIKEFMKNNKFFTPWGDDNLFPVTIMDALRGCAPAQVCIEILSTLTYGNGLKVYETDADGAVKKVFDQTQQNWFRVNRINRYLMQAITDYWTTGEQFAEFLPSASGFCIANQSAPFCRLSDYNNTKNTHEYVYIHGSWKQLPEEKECAKVPLLNYFQIDSSLEEYQGQKVMMRTGAYTPGHLSYNDHPWHALVRNGTLDIFPEIPKIRKRRIKDAMFIKYHVRINEIYWWLKFGGMETGKAAWEAKTSKERSEARSEFYRQLDSHLSGSQNAFKSIFTQTYTTPGGLDVELIKIDKLETEVGESAAFDPDKMSNVADIFLGFGIPSAVANTVLSDSKSRGGGSDIREGNTSVIARLKMHRDNIYAPIDLAMRYTTVNGKPLLADNQFLSTENDLLTTLDKNAGGVTTTQPS